jgi:serine/threonine protein kinase
MIDTRQQLLGRAMQAPATTIDGKYVIQGPCSNAGGMGTLLFVTAVGTSGPALVLKLCKLTDEEMRNRFRREVRMMQQFAGSSYVVPILDANLDHDPPYFVMPHYEHGDLMGKAQQFRGNLVHVEQVFTRMIDCLSHLHERDVYHRDVKPQNFLLGGGSMVVSDLGLCTEHESPTGFTRSTQWAGTPGYMPPEFMNGGFKEADATSDMFMLGKSFYTILSGRDPMYLVADGIPPQLFPILERCCAINQSSRYPSLASLKQSLKSAFDVLLGRAVGPGKAYALMRAIGDKLRLSKQYSPVEVAEFVEELGHLSPGDQHQMCLELPTEAFLVLSQALVQSHLTQFIQIYRGMVENATYSWSFAEDIAKNMRVFFESNNAVASDKAEALRVAIIAAVRQNRFAAMETCKALIVGAEDAELGQRVHDILIAHDTHFIQHIDPAECRNAAVRAAIVNVKAAADARYAAVMTDDDFTF